MTKTTLLTITLAVVFSISMGVTTVMADIEGSLTVESASSEDGEHKMAVEDKVKEIPANKANDLITFWAWAIPVPADAPGGTVLTVDAITIHHGVNDHQAFDDGSDNNPTNQDIRSTPVQSFHPHVAHLDKNSCVIGLESPKSDFKVIHNTLTLESSDDAFAVATGTIGERDECPLGLGITSLVTPPTPLPIP